VDKGGGVLHVQDKQVQQGNPGPIQAAACTEEAYTLPPPAFLLGPDSEYIGDYHQKR